MKIFYNVDSGFQVKENGSKCTRLPFLAYGDRPEITFSVRNSQNEPVDLSAAAAWEFVLDADCTSSTVPLCHVSSQNIVYDQTDRTLTFTVDAETGEFYNAVDGKQHLPLAAELYGSDTAGNRIFRFAFSLIGLMPVSTGDGRMPMTISEIEQNESDIAGAIENKGVSIPDNAVLSDMPGYIGEIKALPQTILPYMTIPAGAYYNSESNCLFGVYLDVYGHFHIRFAEVGNGVTYVQSGGIVSGEGINEYCELYGKLYVLAGGKVKDLRCGSWWGGADIIHIYGLLDNVQGDNYEKKVVIHSGGTAKNIRGGYTLDVESGGMALNTHLDNCILLIASGGVANGLTVGYDGTVTISDGGTLTGVDVSENPSLNMEFEVRPGDSQTLIEGTCNGNAFIYSGGTATGVPFGVVKVNSGGVMINPVALDGSQELNVLSGGTVLDFAITGAYPYFTLNYPPLGESADTTLIRGTNSNGEFVLSAGVMHGWQIYNGAELHVAAGGKYTALVQNTGGRLVLDNFTPTATTEVNGQNEYGSFAVSGGTANNMVIGLYARQNILPGAVFNSATLKGGIATVSSGATLSGATIINGGVISAVLGGTASSTVLSSGTIHVYNGGAATDTQMTSGYLYASSGGVVQRTTKTNGTAVVYNGGIISGIANSSGALTASSGGVITEANVSGGNMYVYNGGRVEQSIISGGRADVASGGTLENSVNSGGSMFVSSTGKALNITAYGGSITVSNGGTLTYVSSGAVTITSATGATVTKLN